MKGKNKAKEEENMVSKMASEEHFIQSQISSKDLEALCILEDPKKALDKLLNLSKSENITEKIQYIRHLAEIVSSIGEEGIASLDVILTSIKDDSIDVKKEMVKQIIPLAHILSQETKYSEKITTELLPILFNLLKNSHNPELKEVVMKGMMDFASFLTKEDQEKLVMPFFTSLIEDDDNEENRVVGIKLFSCLAFDFGQDLTEKFLIKDVLTLEKDTASIRKEIIENIPFLAKQISTKIFKDKLIPFYLRLCKDKNWGVRKSCADILYDVSSLCEEGDLKKLREKELTDVMNNFLKDSQKAVKVSAYKNLGLFISTLKDLNIHQNLFNSYISMTSGSIKSLGVENEILYSCSYSFSAVLCAMGSSKWPELSETFKALLLGDDEVQKPLAYSLHEIANIIGKDDSEHDLLFILECYLKGQNAEIKYGALRNLHIFLKVFPVGQRDKMVNLYQQLTENQRNWRVLELIAGQMENLALAFSPKVVFEVLVPISFELCKHTVFSVRKKAAENVNPLFNVLSEIDEEYKKFIIEKILEFGKSNKFSDRQMFVVMVGKIMLNKSPHEYFSEQFSSLTNDKVAAVRVSIAQTLEELYQNKISPEISQMIVKMKDDSSQTVKDIIDSILFVNT